MWRPLSLEEALETLPRQGASMWRRHGLVFGFIS